MFAIRRILLRLDVGFNLPKAGENVKGRRTVHAFTTGDLIVKEAIGTPTLSQIPQPGAISRFKIEILGNGVIVSLTTLRAHQGMPLQCRYRYL